MNTKIAPQVALMQSFGKAEQERLRTMTEPELLFYLDNYKTWAMNEVLIRCRGNQTKAAKILGISRGTMRKRLREKGYL